MAIYRRNRRTQRLIPGTVCSFSDSVNPSRDSPFLPTHFHVVEHSYTPEKIPYHEATNPPLSLIPPSSLQNFPSPHKPNHNLTHPLRQTPPLPQRPPHHHAHTRRPHRLPHLHRAALPRRGSHRHPSRLPRFIAPNPDSQRCSRCRRAGIRFEAAAEEEAWGLFGG